MKITNFIINRSPYYLTFIAFCLFLYLLVPNSTFMGVLIGLFISEIQRFFEIKESKEDQTKVIKRTFIFAKQKDAWKTNWKVIFSYIFILALIWIVSNLYLYFTNN